jgi:quercetin dioxygenase-like cupin family protein
MSRWRVVALSAALTTAVVVGVGIIPSFAQEAPPPIATELLTGRAVFPDDVDMRVKVKSDEGTHVVRVDDPSRIVTGRFTIQPGAQFPWHTHAGPVAVNVVQGTLVYVAAEGCAHIEYPAGSAFFDLGHGHVHTAFNPGPGETVLVATFFEAPPEPAALIIPADAPPDCEV